MRISGHARQFWVLYGMLFVLAIQPTIRVQAVPSQGWALVWSDEFDGNDSNTNSLGLNLDKWAPALPWDNCGDRRWFKDDSIYGIMDDDVSVTSGMMRIRAQKRPVSFNTPGGCSKTFSYTAGWAHSNGRYRFTYGLAEARLRFPSGPSMWPAWWMLADGWPPEYDIAEKYSNGTLHQGVAYTPLTTNVVAWDSAWFASDPVYDWNTWQMDWRPGVVNMWKNGTVRNSIVTNAIPNKGMYFLFSHGNDNTDAAQPYPNYFDVDYVRVYKRSEYVYNGNFEAWYGGWSMRGAETAAMGSGGADGSGKCMRIGNGNTTNDSAVEANVYGLMPDTDYLLQAWSRTDSDWWPTVYLGVKNHGAAQVTRTQNRNTWKEFIIPFTTGSTSTTATVFGWIAGNQSWARGFVDDFNVRRPAFVHNPGFEAGEVDYFWDDSYGTRSTGVSNPRGGQYAATLGAAWSALQQVVLGLRTNTTYRFSGYVRGGGNAVAIGAKNFGGTEVNQSVTTSTSYGRAEVTFTTGSTNTSALLYAWLANYNGTMASLDDFFFAEPLSSPWLAADVGTVGLTGEAGRRGQQFVVRGAGADIWNTTEAFRFVYLPVTNNFVVTARLRSLDYTHSNAKAGLMIGESASTGNRLVGIGWLPQGRVEGLLRANAADPISTPWGPALSSAPWLRVTRNGTLLTASYSTDGNNWTTHVSTNLTVAANLIAGLYVCSHDSSETAEAVFDNLVVNRAPTLSPIANRNLNVGQWLAVTNTAFDPDSATTNLTFALLSQPGGATLNPATGVLNWRPGTSRAGSSNWFNLSVTDDGWPSLSATQGFAVTVNPLAPVSLSSAVTGGSILNLSFTGQVGPDYTIQSSTNLATNAWVHVLTTNLTVPGPVLWLQSIPSGGEAQRFYRVVVGP